MVLELSLSFTRKIGENEWEDFHHSFTSDESLYPILEKMQMFLDQMGFVTDGKTLELVDSEETVANDRITEYTGDNVKPFPTPFNQE